MSCILEENNGISCQSDTPLEELLKIQSHEEKKFVRENEPSPSDKYYLVYLTFFINGIAVSINWHIFVFSFRYFVEFKLSRKYIGYFFPHLPNFLQYMTLCLDIPNFFCTWLNIVVDNKGTLTRTIVWSMFINFLVIIVTIILAIVDSSSWPFAFFYITLTSIVILSVTSGVIQSSAHGLVSNFPRKYTGAIMLGCNTNGAVLAIANIFSSMTTSNMRMAAVSYFTTALIVILVASILSFALQHNKYFQHFLLLEKSRRNQKRQLKTISKPRPPYLYIFKKASPQLYNIFVNSFIAILTYPSVLANIRATDPNFPIPPDYFSGITCFATYNACLAIGTLLPNFFMWPRREYLWVPVTIRVLYVPFFLLCNYQVHGVERTLPVLVTKEWVYWIANATYGFGSGFFTTQGLMHVSRIVEVKYATIAAMFGSAMLLTGIMSGILASFIWPWMISHVG